VYDLVCAIFKKFIYLVQGKKNKVMPKYLTNTTQFNDNRGTYIADGKVTTNQLNLNGTFYINGSMINGVNNITFNQQFAFTDFQQNVHIYGTLLLDYNGETYNVGQYIASGSGGGGGGYPSINYNSTTGTTTFTGSLVFPSESISSASINNSDFMTITTNQTITSSKSYTLQQFFQGNIRLDGSLLLNSGNLTLTNINLQKIQYLSNVSSDIAAALSTLSTKLTAVSYVVGSPNITTIADKLQCSVVSFSNTLNGVSSTTFGYISTLSANAQNQLTSNSNDIQVLKDATRNLTATSTQSTFSQTLNSNTFTCSSINGFSSSDFSNAITYSKNLSSDSQSQLTALQNKTQYLSYDTNTSSFSNTLNSSSFVFTNSINGYSTTSFSTTLDYCRTLTSDCQNQITAVVATSATALAGSTANSATLAVLTTTTLPAMSALITANSTAITNVQGDITTLQQKTQTLSYSNATTVTSISGICNLSTLRFTSLDSGFTQITNSPVVIIGTCEHRNGLSITNGFGISCDGGIVQNNNSGNTFNGSVSCIRDFTTSGTNSNLNSSNIQIGTSSASALTINSTSTINSDVTLSATKKLVIKNIVARNLDDIYFGGEAGAYTNYNVYFNMKTAFNEPVSILANQQQGTALLRYSSTSYNDNFSVNASTSATLTSASIAVNAPTVNIGTNQGVAAANVINIGSVASISFINLNGVISAPFGITSTSIFSQW
jgi:hypothetical protein